MSAVAERSQNASPSIHSLTRGTTSSARRSFRTRRRVNDVSGPKNATTSPDLSGCFSKENHCAPFPSSGTHARYAWQRRPLTYTRTSRTKRPSAFGMPASIAR